MKNRLITFFILNPNFIYILFWIVVYIVLFLLEICYFYPTCYADEIESFNTSIIQETKSLNGWTNVITSSAKGEFNYIPPKLSSEILASKDQLNVDLYEKKKVFWDCINTYEKRESVVFDPAHVAPVIDHTKTLVNSCAFDAAPIEKHEFNIWADVLKNEENTLNNFIEQNYIKVNSKYGVKLSPELRAECWTNNSSTGVILFKMLLTRIEILGCEFDNLPGMEGVNPGAIDPELALGKEIEMKDKILKEKFVFIQEHLNNPVNDNVPILKEKSLAAEMLEYFNSPISDDDVPILREKSLAAEMLETVVGGTICSFLGHSIVFIAKSLTQSPYFTDMYIKFYDFIRGLL